MNQAAFEASHQRQWDELEQTVTLLETPRKRPNPEQLRRFSDRYRELARQHALAVDRQYSAGLVNKLQTLLQRCHHQLYRNRELLLSQTLHFLAIGFPRALRRHARYFWFASALFYLPALIMGVWSATEGDAIYTLMDPPMVAEIEYAYDPTTEHKGRGAERQASTNFQMLGFYVYNNTSIGFRSFASGMLFGVGTALITLYNGLYIGAVAGHLTGLGYTDVFWPFVAAHGAFELTAICISAAAGFLLGVALLLPGQRRRVDALRHAAREAIPLISGAAMFFFIAAFIEAFWSPLDLEPVIKYAVAGVLWLFVAAYLGLAGRKADAA